MNYARQPKSPFNLDQELPQSYYAEGIHPRVTVLVRDPSAQLLLLLPTKAADSANAFMFPQGPIARHETPRNALGRLLQDECGYDPKLILLDEARVLGVSPIDQDDDGGTKIHHIVFVSMLRFRQPHLNKDNRKWLFARGPNNLWSKIDHCRPDKKRMMVASVFKAVDDGLLHTNRWSRERFEAIRGFVAA